MGILIGVYMYNISFDNIGMMLAIAVLFVQFLLFDTKQKSNKLFIAFVFSALFECIFDILTAQNIDGFIILSDRVSVWFNDVYFILTIISAFFGYLMTSERVRFKNKIYTNIVSTVAILSILLIFSNGFTGLLFTFINGVYTKTPMFNLIYIISAFFLGSIPITVLVRRKHLSADEKLAPCLYVFTLLVAFVMQIIFPKILLNGFGKGVSAVVYCLLLEAPEHIKVREAVEELKKAQADELETINKLSEANDQKTAFLVKMTHRLRTPINAILGFSEIYIKENEDRTHFDKISAISKSGEHLIDLVDDIVDFSQIDTCEIEVNEREYEIAEAYLMFMEILEKHKSSYRQALTRKVTSNLPKRLYGDVKKVALICERLCNLLYSIDSDNYISLDVCLNKIIDNKVYVDIVIEDKKSSFKETDLNEYMDVIIANKHLESLKTELKFEPVYGGGGRFSFLLEQEIVDLKPVGNLDEAIEKYNKHKVNNFDDIKFIMPKAKILVVDDTPINLMVIEGLLTPFKTNVKCVKSGPEAIEYMKNNDVDFVFMDILMPEMDGIETLNHIRQDEDIRSKDAVIVALTANIFSGAKDYYLSCGFADYITKPVSGHRMGLAFKEFIPDKLEEDWATVDVTNEEL